MIKANPTPERSVSKEKIISDEVFDLFYNLGNHPQQPTRQWTQLKVYSCILLSLSKQFTSVCCCPSSESKNQQCLLATMSHAVEMQNLNYNESGNQYINPWPSRSVQACNHRSKRIRPMLHKMTFTPAKNATNSCQLPTHKDIFKID